EYHGEHQHRAQRDQGSSSAHPWLPPLGRGQASQPSRAAGCGRRETRVAVGERAVVGGQKPAPCPRAVAAERRKAPPCRPSPAPGHLVWKAGFGALSAFYTDLSRFNSSTQTSAASIAPSPGSFPAAGASGAARCSAARSGAGGDGRDVRAQGVEALGDGGVPAVDRV